MLFRINEFNIDDALALFLPYHETPHFVKLLSILHVKYAPKLFRFSVILTLRQAAVNLAFPVSLQICS